MCDNFVTMSSNQSMAKKHTWKGDIVVSTQEDRSSPSRDSLDSGFSSFPASPSNNALIDAPPQLINCSLYNNQLQEDAPPPLLNCALYNNQLQDDEDEPVCKMPRLVPIDEEELECEQIESPASSPLSIPEKEWEKPKPEAASIPQVQEESTSTKQTQKRRVRISTPDEVADENEDPYAKCMKPQHPCLWANCTEEFYAVNDLYDHTMEQHFCSLRPSGSSSTSTIATSNQRKRIIRDDKEELASEKKYRCQWRDCEMSLRRGTPEKKFEWLQNHFKTRHAQKAQPVKCLMKNCPIRFQNEKALHVHLLHAHDDRPARKTQQPVIKTISCYDYEAPQRTELYGVIDFVDKYTFDLIGQKVRDYYQQEPVQSVQQSSTIPCMTKKKTLNILRKIFSDSILKAHC